MTDVKKGIWIVALVIVMGSLVALTWGYGMLGDELEDVLQSFFESTSAPAETVPVETVPPETTAPGTTPGAETTQTAPPETTMPETEAPTTLPPETTPATEPSVEVPGLTAQHAIVADLATGETLFYKSNGTEKVYPASVTKVFTAYVALQYLDLDQHITVGDEIDLLKRGASRARMQKGESTTVANLIYGLFLPSGSDVAYILAAATGRELRGSDLTAAEAVKVFVDEMNNMARDLGMTGTHFANPDGYHSGSHYTCLNDLVTIAQMALREPQIVKCTSTYSIQVELDDGTLRRWTNTNQTVNPYSGFYSKSFSGLKTGHTNNAGYCLLLAVRQDDGNYVIVGVFGCERDTNRFRDAYKLAQIFGGIE